MPDKSRSKYVFPDFWVPLVPLVALLAWIYYPTFVWMADRWGAADSYYGHGFLMPAVSLYLVWSKRAELRGLERRQSWLGLFFLVPGALIQLGSSVLRIYFLSAFSFILVLAGLILLFFGPRIFRALWFPVFFLLMMIPLPLLMISEITLKLKFFVSELAAFVLNRIGIETVRDGSYLVMPNSYLLVGDPCSGLRSFLTFLCLGLVFAYLSRLRWWARAVLVAAGLPLAVLSNLLRVVFLSLVAEIYGMEAAGGKVHDYSGYAVFVIAFLCFLYIQNRLERGYAPVR